jgi:spoIIIJ-associated protein
VEENQNQQENRAEIKAEGEGKTIAEAEAAALARLREVAGSFDEEDAELVVLEEGSRGFLGMGSNLARVEARLSTQTKAGGTNGEGALASGGEEAKADESSDEPLARKGAGGPGGVEAEEASGREEAGRRLNEYLETILAALGLEGSVEIGEDDESLFGNVTGDDLGIFIGRHGQTIDAIQYLANAIAFRGLNGRKRIIVDAEDYRERRAEALRSLAERGVDEVERGEAEYELKPMSAAERRIIHVYLQDRAGIETFSEGRDPFRRVIICRSQNR